MNQLKSHWTSLSDIKSALSKKWQKGIILRESIYSGTYFPLKVPISGPTASELSEHFDAARTWVQQFVVTGNKVPYEIEWVSVNHRVLGNNQIPQAIYFKNLPMLVHFIGKTQEHNLFNSLKDELLSAFPQLKDWLLRYPLDALEFSQVWSKLIRVAQWMTAHPRPGIYLRQISIPEIDTKFVEKHKKILSEWFDSILDSSEINNQYSGSRGFESRYGFLAKPVLVRFRFLDKKKFINGMSDITIRADEFCSMQFDINTVFVTENDINGLTFPDFERAMVIFGRGYGFEYLECAQWLKNKDIYYWGDIDTHGFAILNQFRMHFPQTRSMLMDRQILMMHKEMWVKEGTPVNATLEKLNNGELALYKELIENKNGDSIRLEQESVSYDCVLKFLCHLD